ncbi:MAG: hypothetical protein LH478_05645 [Chitinophagaceae bacterium]|nr:hypothetical protein [Chitinophagaceae bacterium]
MISSICTLFEGHYHFGVAALANSLNYQGYKGVLYAGYRGKLPDWCNNGNDKSELTWKGATKFKVAEEFSIQFLPLDTDYHFTNYKPDFMLDLLDGPCKQVESIFYFDPDIVITADWSSFEDWVDCGVALCEDVNSPLAENHPRRAAWRSYFNPKGYTLKFKDSIYANGGFIGVNIENRSFLDLWKNIQIEMAPRVGGLNRSALSGKKIPKEERGPFSPFSKTDQDALNAAIEAWQGKVSLLGKEAMGFASGLTIMPHALGHPKPWKWKTLSQVLNGAPPRLVDREYWKAVNGPIITHSAGMVRRRKIFIDLAAFVGRFYRRGGNSLY